VRHAIVVGPGGKRVLRLLVPSQCEFSCERCPFAGGTSELDALARSAAASYRAGSCDAVFLTAGVPRDASAATRRLLQLVELLRFKYAFRGYLHVKAIPGADAVATQRLVRLVDRVSYALEAPCADALTERGGVTPEAAQALEARALAELQRARVASGRSSPPLLPAAFQTGRAGARLAAQASLFDTRNRLESNGYTELPARSKERADRACA
jgi:predicted DNA-binding helix-hairpin-helix protein